MKISVYIVKWSLVEMNPQRNIIQLWFNSPQIHVFKNVFICLSPNVHCLPRAKQQKFRLSD